MSPARTWTSVLAVAVAAAIASALVAALPSLRFAYHAPAVRVALETAAAVISLLAAYLVFGRFRRDGRVDTLLLVLGLGVLAASNLVATIYLALPASDVFRIALTAANAAGAVVLAVAAFVPARRAQGAVALIVTLTAAGTFVLIGVLVSIDDAVEGVAQEVVRNPTHPQLESDAGLLFAQSLAVAAFVTAAVGFARRAVRDADELLVFFAVGAVLAAVARVHYILFAPAHGGLVRTGDVFRALFYAVLFAGAAREIDDYWRRLAQTAVLEERRRIARDLHDGVAQELALIGRRAKRLVSATGDDGAREILASAERALGDSRRAIAALTKPLDVPLAAVLEEAVGEIAGRYDVAVDFAFEQDVVVDADTREALVRIACEAVANAARHGGARRVRVALSQDDRVRFGVADDGAGFDTSVVKPSRFGIQIMRERAQAAGGSFDLRSEPGVGTTVEVVFP